MEQGGGDAPKQTRNGTKLFKKRVKETDKERGVEEQEENKGRQKRREHRPPPFCWTGRVPRNSGAALHQTGLFATFARCHQTFR